MNGYWLCAEYSDAAPFPILTILHWPRVLDEAVDLAALGLVNIRDVQQPAKTELHGAVGGAWYRRRLRRIAKGGGGERAVVRCKCDRYGVRFHTVDFNMTRKHPRCTK